MHDMHYMTFNKMAHNKHGNKKYCYLNIFDQAILITDLFTIDNDALIVE